MLLIQWLNLSFLLIIEDNIHQLLHDQLFQQEEFLRSAQFGKCFLDGVVEESNEKQEQQPSDETGETGETGEGQEEDEEGLLGVIPVPVVKEKGIVDQFQHVTHVLRVLNTLRDPTVSD